MTINKTGERIFWPQFVSPASHPQLAEALLYAVRLYHMQRLRA